MGGGEMVGKVWHRGGWGRANNGGDGGIVTMRPADRGQIEARICGRSLVIQAANSGVKLNDRSGVNVVVVAQSQRAGRISLRAPIDAKAILQRVNRKIRHFPAAEPGEQALTVSEVLIDAHNHLILISAGPGDSVEVVDGSRRSDNAGAVSDWPEIQESSRRGVDTICRNHIAGKRYWCGGTSGASALGIHNARTRIDDRDIDRREIPGALGQGRNRRGEGLSSP